MGFWRKKATILDLKTELREKDSKLRALTKEYDELAEAYKEAIKPVAPPPCTHTWLDFPWYLDHSWKPGHDNYNPDIGESTLTIYEPYVCVHCQKRKDVRLYSERETGVTAKRHWNKKAEWEEQYKDHLKPKPIVEDMINDAVMVDKGKVAIVAKLRGIKDEERKDKNQYRVELSLPQDLLSPAAVEMGKAVRT